MTLFLFLVWLQMSAPAQLDPNYYWCDAVCVNQFAEAAQRAADETDGKPPAPIATFHHCAIDGGTGNADGYQTMSEIYKCDEGRIELKGKWTQIIEYSNIYRQEMGRPAGTPEHVSIAEEKKHFRWCPVKNAPVPELELCGLWPENGEVTPVDKCTPGKRGDPYAEDCVCRKDGKSLFCKER